MWMAQDTQGNLWLMKVYNFFDDTTIVLGGPDLKSIFMPAVPDVGDPAGIIMPETATNYCRVVEADVSINTNFGSYDSCIKSPARNRRSPSVWFMHVVGVLDKFRTGLIFEIIRHAWPVPTEWKSVWICDSGIVTIPAYWWATKFWNFWLSINGSAE